MPTSTGKVAKVVKADKTVQPLPFQLITKLADIKKETDALKVDGANYQHRTHVLACSVLAAVSRHGNINVLTHFLASVPDMVRVNALQSWFEAFGQVSYAPLKEGETPVWRIDRSKKTKLGDAMVKPFWKFKAHEGAPYEPLDMKKWLEQAIARLTKDAQKTGTSHDHLVLFLKTYNPEMEQGKPTQVTTADLIQQNAIQQAQANAANGAPAHH
ncbi:hypothetical protein HOS22_gp04 [Rhizobium phage RHEph08]|uniref:Uncharacterized protein n=1 Tax=Rhizobium phage RHEph08 TaxID=1220715 RepID=L7TK73_9CAUD|nr:hypothetical protein HOS22_gp04 [Rhizobium phage RHEph08]AGC35928.1 hypothetical protein RHEph08_gp004 [Rhizobium phage RHEph08]